MDCANKWSIVVKLLPQQNRKALFLIIEGKKEWHLLTGAKAKVTKVFGSFWVQMWSRRLCLPLGAPGCTEGWSCPVSAWPLQESLPPVAIAMWADLFLCLYRKPPCPRWSARSHTPPLKGDTTQGLICRIFFFTAEL